MTDPQSAMTDHLPKAMLIDLDDTILAYEPVAADALRAVCDAHVDRLPGWTVEQLVAGLDSYRRWFWSDPERHRRARLSQANIRHELVVGAFRQMGIEALDVARSIGDAYAREREQRARPFPRRARNAHDPSGSWDKTGADHQRLLSEASGERSTGSTSSGSSIS